ncbi:hypothetical protein DRJ48_03730, partial [Candidatus Woesearchaeota archaeon]
VSQTAWGFPLDATNDTISKAKQYLQSQQEPNGAIGDLALSNWVSMAVYALGENSDSWRVGSNDSLSQYIESHVGELDPNKATDWARMLLSAVAMGKDPHFFGGEDLVERVKGFHNNQQIGDTSLLNDDFWALLALCAAGECNSQEAIDAKTFIVEHQNSDGGWSWSVGGSSDVDDTSAAIMALISAGEDLSSTVIIEGLAYIKSQQDENGGFLSWGETNSDTDAWAIDAIVAGNQDPTDVEWQSALGKSPVDDLLSFQNTDGSFNFSTSYPSLSPVLNTAYAINALLGVPYSSIHSNLREVSLRIEGSTEQIFSGNIAVENSVTIRDTTGSPHVIGFPSAITTVDKASRLGGFGYEAEYYEAWDALYIKSIDNEEAAGTLGWNYRVNHIAPPLGADKYEIQDGDDVLWFYGEWDDIETRVSVDKEIVNLDNSESLTVTVEYYDTGNLEWFPLYDAEVHFAQEIYTTDTNGIAEIHPQNPGSYDVYATKDGYIRSNRVNVSVVTSGSNTQTVTLSAEIVPAVSFEVTPASIDFGKIAPGYSKNGNPIVIANTGGWDIIVSATVDGQGLFAESLLLDSMMWNEFSSYIASNPSTFYSTFEVSTKLDVPEDYDGVGQEQATLTFWAQGVEP